MTMLSSEVLRQYEAARNQAARFDLSKYAKIQLTGKDARAFLHNLCTNDVKNLKPGQGCEAFFTNSKARIVAHVIISCVNEETFLIDSSVPGETIAKHLDHFLISEQVEIADRTNELALLHLCGPGAQEELVKAGYEIPEGHLQHVARGSDTIRRHDRLGIAGYDLLCEKGREHLGTDIVAAGDEAFDVLRIEAGLPISSKDMDENRFVMEVGRTAQAISFTKGCFLGQEPIVMARDRGHVNRFLTRIQIGEGSPPPGTKLLRDGAEAGEITSSTFSPQLNAPIALAYLRRGCHEPNTELRLADGRLAKVLG